MTSEPNPSRIMETGMAFWPSRVLLTAVKLGVFTALGGGAMRGQALADAVGLHESRTWDFLDTLVALQFLERDGSGCCATYRNTQDTAAFLDRSKPDYLGGILEMAHDRLYSDWGRLIEGLRTGEAQAQSKGNAQATFNSLYADRRRLEQFISAMTSVQRRSFAALAEAYDFSRHRHLCDIGGSEAALSVAIASRHPQLKCSSFDLPAVEPVARRAVEKAGLSGRITLLSGDFFADPFPAADVVTMGNILHDWGLEQKKLLIRKAYEALPAGGVYIVIESIIDDERRQNAHGLMMSLNMLIETGSGFNLTDREFARWCEEAGFRRTEVRPLVGPSSAAIAYK